MDNQATTPFGYCKTLELHLNLAILESKNFATF